MFSNPVSTRCNFPFFSVFLLGADQSWSKLFGHYGLSYSFSILRFPAMWLTNLLAGFPQMAWFFSSLLLPWRYWDLQLACPVCFFFNLSWNCLQASMWSLSSNSFMSPKRGPQFLRIMTSLLLLISISADWACGSLEEHMLNTHDILGSISRVTYVIIITRNKWVQRGQLSLLFSLPAAFFLHYPLSPSLN